MRRLRSFLRDLSIKHKLLMMTASTSVSVLLVACATLMALDLRAFRDHLREQRETFSSVLSGTLRGPVAARDGEAVELVLDSLRADPYVLSARVLDTDGALLGELDSSKGERFGRTVPVVRPILADAQQVGEVQVEYSTRQFERRTVGYGVALTAILMLAVLASVVISARVRGAISEPILELARSLKWVSLDRNYSRRAIKRGKDEVGELVDAFNDMLSQIEERDNDVRLAKNKIEVEHKQKQQLLSAITSLLIMLDEHDTIRYWNGPATKALGVDGQAALGRPFDHVGVIWNWDEILGAVQKCRLEDRPVRLNSFAYRTSDGRTGFLDLSFNRFYSVTGNHCSLLVTGSDVTESRMLEAQLQESQRLESIGQLAAGIAHEINTPTQYVGDNARFLKESFEEVARMVDSFGKLLARAKVGRLGPDEITELEALSEEIDVAFLLEEIPDAIDQSLEGVERVSSIVKAMKEFSHPGKVEMVETDLNRAIESTVTVARNEWKYVAELALELDPSLPHVPCLVGEFNQVILNILLNATHAIADARAGGRKDKGTITIRTCAVDDQVEVSIADTGTGIPEEARAKVFDPFFTTKDVGRGTGQGLSISHAVIVQKHGGTLTLETEEGVGTTFFIRLPLLTVTAREGVAA